MLSKQRGEYALQSSKSMRSFSNFEKPRTLQEADPKPHEPYIYTDLDTMEDGKNSPTPHWNDVLLFCVEFGVCVSHKAGNLSPTELDFLNIARLLLPGEECLLNLLIVDFVTTASLPGVSLLWVNDGLHLLLLVANRGISHEIEDPPTADYY